ncbi:MAG: hypothetical protein ACRC5H_10780 [Treponemataceae bacterium]
MSKIRVQVNGKDIIYENITIHKSLDEICHTIEVEVPSYERQKIKKHDRLQVLFTSPYLTDHDGKRPVSTVLIDEICGNTENESKTIIVRGRSKARDIIDSQWSGEIKGSPDLLEVTRSIARDFSIDVLHMPTNQNSTKPVESFSWENESPWSKLLLEADAQGYIITSNQVGNLYVIKPSSSPRPKGLQIIEGVNVKRVSITESGAEQFNKYIVRGENNEATVTDSTCPNKRILTINVSDFNFDSEKLQRRARTEMLRRRENKVIVTVNGWGLTDEQIKALGNTFQKEVFWECNFLTPVKLPTFAIDDVMIISEVSYHLGSSVFEAEITLVKKEVYE